jgi:3-hydroxyisobutyrate dehydrogenase-like beta-hydroxyacid dehydrogenase
MAATIGILHPGEMGAAVGACARKGGARVLWASAGRGPSTQARAESAGLEDVRTLRAALEASEVLLSVCPPHAAVAVAEEIAALGFRGLFVDANAVSPETSRRIGRIVEEAGATFVDGGIIGPPPNTPGTTRLYLAGSAVPRIATLFEGSPLATVVLDGPPGAASAIKVCYAAWNKGTIALLATIQALARHEGVTTALAEEWRLSQPEVVKRLPRIADNARKGWRWIGEMEEIAATFANAGLPDGFGLAAADVYRRLETFKDARDTTLEEVVAALAPPRPS